MPIGFEISELFLLLFNDMLKHHRSRTEWTDLQPKEQYLPQFVLHNPFAIVEEHVPLWIAVAHSCESPLDIRGSFAELDPIPQGPSERQGERETTKSMNRVDEIVLILTSFVCGRDDSSCCENIVRNFSKWMHCFSLWMKILLSFSLLSLTRRNELTSSCSFRSRSWRLCNSNCKAVLLLKVLDMPGMLVSKPESTDADVVAVCILWPPVGGVVGRNLSFSATCRDLFCISRADWRRNSFSRRNLSSSSRRARRSSS